MIRAILATLFLALIAASPAHAFLDGSVGTPIPACQSPTGNGSTISPANTACYLTDSSSHSAEFAPAPGAATGHGTCTLNSPTCLEIYQAPTPSSRSQWTQTNYTTEAILCNAQGNPAGGSGNYINYAQTDAYRNASLTSWFQGYDASGRFHPDTYQVAPSCGGGPYADFIDGSTAYYDLWDACQAATAGDTIEVKPMPAGIPFWNQKCLMAANNLTLNIDSGVKLYGKERSCGFGVSGLGVADICISGTGITINGAGATLGYVDGGGINDVIGVKPNTANPTIQGAAGNYLIIDCQQLYGQAYFGTVMHAIETSRSDGIVTISHVFTENCGGPASHAIYTSWGGGAGGYSPLNPDPAYCAVLNDVIVKDASGDAPALKMDDACGNSQGTFTNVSVYCTIESNPDPNEKMGYNCDENEPIDFQCGGWHSVTNSLFEMYSGNSNDDGFAFSKLAWQGQNGCPKIRPAVNNVHFDKDIFILDGTPYVPDGYAGHLLVACGSAGDANDCNANAGPNVSTKSTSSLTIGTGTQTLTIPRGISDPSLPPPTQLALGEFPVTITSTANPANNMVADVIGYTASTGQLQVSVLQANGAGTFASWNVVTAPHAAVCITNSQIVEDDTNYPGPSHNLEIGPGVYVNTGCTGSGADTNTYYAGQTGTASAGRRSACSASNWSTGSGTNCAFPFVPRYLTENETHDQLVAQARAAGFCGKGTSADPIRACADGQAQARGEVTIEPVVDRH